MFLIRNNDLDDPASKECARRGHLPEGEDFIFEEHNHGRYQGESN